MNYSNDIRNWLLLIGTIITMVGIGVNWINNLFINTIKVKYQSVPGKQSRFSFIIQILVYVIVLISLASWVKSMIYNNGAESNSLANQYTPIIIIAAILAIIFIILPIWGTIYIYSRLMESYIAKLENRNISNLKMNYIIWIRIIKYSSLVIPVVVFLILICRMYGDNKTLIFLIGYCSFLFLFFCMLIRLENVYKHIISNNIYILKLKDEKIVCNLYLEYEEFYLVFEDQHERYIKKSEVSEIRKVVKD